MLNDEEDFEGMPDYDEGRAAPEDYDKGREALEYDPDEYDDYMTRGVSFDEDEDEVDEQLQDNN